MSWLCPQYSSEERVRRGSAGQSTLLGPVGRRQVGEGLGAGWGEWFSEMLFLLLQDKTHCVM